MAAHGDCTTVHIVERMAPGGVETLVLDMIAGMPGRHVIFSLSGCADALRLMWPRLAREGFKLEAFDKPLGLRPRLIAQLAGRLRALGPDVVIAHHIGPLIYGGVAARLARVPVVLHVEHDGWHYQSSRRRHLAKVFFKLVRPRRVVVSDEIAGIVTRHFGGHGVTVVAPGIDMDRFRPRDRDAARVRLELPADVALIGTSGRLVPVKNQVALIEALARLRSDPRDGRTTGVVVVGEGPEREALVARAEALGLGSAIHLLGHRDDIADVLPAFDIYCLPSLNEGLPRGVLEAQAVGLPIVASAVGALADAVCPQSGRLVPPADVPALAAALAARLANPVPASIPRAFVGDRYSLTTTLEKFKNLTQQTGTSHVH